MVVVQGGARKPFLLSPDDGQLTMMVIQQVVDSFFRVYMMYSYPIYLQVCSLFLRDDSSFARPAFLSPLFPFGPCLHLDGTRRTRGLSDRVLIRVARRHSGNKEAKKLTLQKVGASFTKPVSALVGVITISQHPSSFTFSTDFIGDLVLIQHVRSYPCLKLDMSAYSPTSQTT